MHPWSQPANSFAKTAADVESAQPGGWRKPQLSASIRHEAGRRLKNKPRMEKTCVYSVQGNMKKVATQANVSISTVSRGVNQSGYAASNVRETVLRAMKRLNYPPSAMIARGLRRRSTETIGVLVPQSAHPFFGAIGIAIEKPFGGIGTHPLPRGWWPYRHHRQRPEYAPYPDVRSACCYGQ